MSLELIEILRYLVGGVFIVALAAWILGAFAGAYRLWQVKSRAEENFIENARRFYEQNNPDDALYILNKYMAQLSPEPEAVLLMARSWAAKGESELAGGYYEQYMACMPDDHSVSGEYFELLKSSGNSEEISRLALQMLDMAPGNEELLWHALLAAIERRNVALIRKIQDMIPTARQFDASQVADRIAAYVRSGNVRKTEDYQLLAVLVDLCMSWNQFDAARSVAEVADTADSSLLTGRVLFEGGDVEAAISGFVDYLEPGEDQRPELSSDIQRIIDGQDDVTFANLHPHQKGRCAQVLEQLERPDMAEQLFEEAAISGEKEDWLNLIHARLRSDKMEKATLNCMQMYERFPEALEQTLKILKKIQLTTLSPVVVAHIQKLEDERNVREGRVKHLEQLLKKQNISAENCRELCGLLVESGRIQRSIALSGWASTQFPEASWPVETMVESYMKLDERLSRVFDRARSYEECGLKVQANRLYRLIAGRNAGYRDVSERIAKLEQGVSERGPELCPGSEVMGRFEDFRLVGAGVLSGVYRAYDKKNDRYQAVKVLSESWLDNRKVVDRFIQEGRAAISLEHENIARVIEVIEDAGPCYVMDYVEGYSIGELSDQAGTLSLAVLNRMVSGVCEALAHIHGLGYYCRNLNPGNIMINRNAGIRLIGPGLVPAAYKADIYAESGPLCPIHYMAPEQICGQRIGLESSVFSLSAMIYELMSGHSPFCGENTGQTIQKIFSGDTVPLSEVSECPDSLNLVVMRGLAVKPEERYATVSDFLSAWVAALS